MRKFTKTLAVCTALWAGLCSLAAQSETKKLYGIQGPKLTHQKPVHNTHTYEVKGISYTTKSHHNAKNYVKEGMASYYHKKFTGRRTSSGEPYRPTEYTAAHKTLPLNSYAVVTHLKNNKKVIVRINDRGPFVNGRVVDLSFAAAKELGLIGRGLAKVKVEALHVTPQGKIAGIGANTLAQTARSEEAVKRLDTAISAVNNNQDTYKIKMLNFKNKKQAEQIISQLALENINAEVKSNGEKYDIHFGPIKTQNETQKLKTQLKKIKQSNPLIVYSYNSFQD